MGLLDSIFGGGQSSQSGEGGNSAMLQSVIGLITSQSGGLGGLVEKFKSHGLEEQAKSWIGLGDNQPITADQITKVLGHDKVAQVAEEAGVSHDEASAGLAQYLPKIIDKLTPHGTVPQGDITSQALELLKAHLMGGK